MEIIVESFQAIACMQMSNTTHFRQTPFSAMPQSGKAGQADALNVSSHSSLSVMLQSTRYEDEMPVPYQGRISKLLSSSIESIHVHMSPNLGQVSCGFKSQHLPIHGPTTAQYTHQQAEAAGGQAC